MPAMDPRTMFHIRFSCSACCSSSKGTTTSYSLSALCLVVSNLRTPYFGSLWDHLFAVDSDDDFTELIAFVSSAAGA